MDLTTAAVGAARAARLSRGRLHEYDQELPIVVGAGTGPGDLAAQATELGAVAVVRRPYAARELLKLSTRSPHGPTTSNCARGHRSPPAAGRRRDAPVLAQRPQGHIPPQEFILLRYFAERAEAVLRRTELNRAVWGDKLGVRSIRLTVHVARLRKRVGYDEHDPQWIKAVRGLGYRFTVPPVDLTSAVPSQVTPSQRSLGVHAG